jgi:hypothetical protein
MKVIRGKKYTDPDARPFNFEDYLNDDHNREKRRQANENKSLTIADLDAAGRKGPKYFFITKDSDY